MAQYTQAQIDNVIRMVNAGQITVQELEAQHGMPAAQIQANIDAANLASGVTSMPPQQPVMPAGQAASGLSGVPSDGRYDSSVGATQMPSVTSPMTQENPMVSDMMDRIEDHGCLHRRNRRLH